MQFHENYFKEINEELAPNLNIDENGNITGIDLPLKIQENAKNKLLLYLREIRTNRVFILLYYKELEKKINEVRENIKKNNANTGTSESKTIMVVDNEKINDLSKNQFADSLWNEFASAMEANNLEYLVKKSFDTIQCVDCILIDENKREYYKSEIIFHYFLDKLMHIDSLTKREYSTYMTDSIIRVSYSIKCKSAPEGAYGLVFTFKKQNEEFYFDGMFTAP